MKVKNVSDGLLILPETEFEENYINENFGRGNKLIAFVKCGLSAADLIGIKVCHQEKEKVDLTQLKRS